MSNRNPSLEYVNSILFDLQKAFWDERGKGARFRVTTVGRGYFRDKCLARITARDLDSIISAIEKVLVEEGIVQEQSSHLEDRLLRIRVKGCIHQPVERSLLDKQVEPFTCIPANLIVLAVEEVLNRPVELAEIKVEDDTCHLLLVIFEPRESQ